MESLDPRFDRHAELIARQLDPTHGAVASRDAEASYAGLARRLWPVADGPNDALTLEPAVTRRPARLRGVHTLSSFPSAGRAGKRAGIGRAVAGLAGALVLAIAGWYATHRGSAAGVTHPATPAPREYATAPGQRATVTLVDGTRVTLNVDSRLRIDTAFGHASRVVELDGEAEFSVRHDARRPFVVRANGSYVRDLATVFSVRAYRGTSATQVAVREGRVSVQSPAMTRDAAVLVSAGEMAMVRANGVPAVSRIGVGDPFAWTTGALVLRQVSVGEALVEMSRWYGLEFRATDSTLLAYTISTRLPAVYDAAKIQDLADVLHAKVTREHNVVTLTPTSHLR